MRNRKADPFPSTDDIAERAHDLFVSGGRRVTLIPEYWRTAETELLRRAADQVIGPEVARLTRKPPA